MMETTQGLPVLPSEDGDERIRQAAGAAEFPLQIRAELESVVVDLFDQFQERVVHYVLTFGLPLPDAEDVVQETFLSLFHHLELGRSRSNLNGWIFRVAHNLALKRRRSSLVFGANRDQHHVLTRTDGARLKP